MRQTRNVALYVLLCIIWGSTWLVIKVGYGGLGPFNVAAVRFFLAAAVLALIVPLVSRAVAAGPGAMGAGGVGRSRAVRR